MSLSGMFNGWANMLTAGEDFEVPALLVGKTDDLEDGDDSYELPDPEVRWENKGSPYKGDPPEGHLEEQAWGSYSIVMGSLALILGGDKRSYQLNHWDPARKNLQRREYMFQFEPGDTGFQGGDRL